MAKSQLNEADNLDRFLQAIARVFGVRRSKVERILFQGRSKREAPRKTSRAKAHSSDLALK